MPKNDFPEYIVHDLLSDVPGLSYRSMFGGFGIYRDGRMIALIANDILYVKADDTSRETFQAAQGEPFRYQSGNHRPVVMDYWTVPDAALENGSLLAEWMELGHQAAQRAARPKPPRVSQPTEATPDDMVQRVTAQLQQLSEPAYARAQRWFFKEGIALYGVRTGQVRALADHYYRSLRQTTREELFDLCEELLRQHKQEPLIIAFQWSAKRIRSMDRTDFSRLQRWLKTYVSNWAACDGFATGLLGKYLLRFPGHEKRLAAWERSSNRWVRRASMVSLIPGLARGMFLPEALQRATRLQQDSDDMVRKGVGWTLKVASKRFPSEVWSFIMQHRKHMPRLVLRYAIELLPAHLRRQAMEKS